MFATRLISGIVLVLILGITVYLGGFWFWALLFLISFIGYREFSRAVRNPADGGEEKAWGSLFEWLGLFCVAAYDAALYLKPEPEILLLMGTGALLLFMGAYVLTFPAVDSSRVMELYFGIPYIAVLLGFLYLVRIGEDGILRVLLVFAGSWVCDTAAYVTGMTLGKHKLAPVLSPKKSVEGAVGGVAGSALVGGLLAYLTGRSIPAFVLAAAAAAVLSQLGDLFASGVKRNKGIKDYGQLIPGHGGILDRFDSVIVTAPAVYLVCRLFKV